MADDRVEAMPISCITSVLDALRSILDSLLPSVGAITERRWKTFDDLTKRKRSRFFAWLSEKKGRVAQILYAEDANLDLNSLLLPWLSNGRRQTQESKDKSDRDANNCTLPLQWSPLVTIPLSCKRVMKYILSCMKQSKHKSEVTRQRAPLDSKLCEIHVDIPNRVLTAVSFSVQNDKLLVTAFDLSTRAWGPSFTISCLQDPDTNLFKEYSTSGHGGLMVANDSKSPDNAHLVVFNPSTGERRELPPLQFSRNPVVLHIKVNASTGDYNVIAAGSSSMGSPFSRKVEVYDSRTSKWRSAADIPGPEFGLNEHQAGVCVGGILYFIAFLAGDGGKGIVAFDVGKCEWVEEKSFPVPFAAESNILQLVECDGNLFLFSEQECENIVMHCIDQVGVQELKSVQKVTKTGGRGLLVYPEFTCVPFGAGKLCIFNTLKRNGEVYDVGTGQKCDDLAAPENEIAAGENFFTLNPVSFALHPNLAIKP